jgi:hypothetical protein
MPTSPNQESRHGTKIDSIVLHSTWGSYAGSVAWLCNPTSKASAHYVLSRDGIVATLVPEEYAAWHVRYEATGQASPRWNARSIGIELVDDKMEDGWMTQVQYDKLVMLISQIVVRWNIPITRERIKMHKEIDAKSDPKGWTESTINKLLSDIHNHLYPITEEETMTDDQARIIARSVARVSLQKRFGTKRIIAYKQKGNDGVYYDEAMTQVIPNWDYFLDSGYLQGDIVEI